MRDAQEAVDRKFLAFGYPDAQVAEFCESQASNIRLLLNKTIRNVAMIGEILEIVKGQLGTLFGPWLEYYFHWSEQTARNYIRVKRLVNDNPKVLGLRDLTVVYRLPSYPEEVRDEIIERRLSLNEAEALAARQRAAVWREDIEDLMLCDPGAAYHQIEKALGEPELQAEARDALRAHAEKLALLSDREPAEIMAEAGLTLQERLPPPAQGRVTARLIESHDNISLLIWAGGEPYTIAVFPAQRSPIASAWRSAVIQNTAQFTNAKTLDDVGGELL